MIWVGLTGGIASGKSTAAGLLKKLGYIVVDADQVARDVVRLGSSGLKSVTKSFGNEILSADGSLDRKKMAQIVFNDPQKLKKLENLLHPLVKKAVQLEKAQAQSAGQRLAFYDVPLLFEKDLAKDFDQVILVTCSEKVQRQRLKSRSGLSDDEISARLKNQISLREKEKWADFVIDNEGSFQQLESQLQKVIGKILQKA